MTDYNKLKVAELRTLLKDRGIASTGLTRKAQIIEKLEEHDQQGGTPAAASEKEDDAPAVAPEEEEPAQEAALQATASDEDKPEETPATTSQTETAQVEQVKDSSPSKSQSQEEGKPAEPAPEPVSTTEPVASPVRSSPRPETATAAATATGDNEPSPAKPTESASATEAMDFAPAPMKTPSPAPDERPSVEPPIVPPLREQSTDSASATASQIDPKELEADRRKRKRRSPSPDVPLEEVKAKKPRPSVDVAPEVHLKEDDDVVMEQRRPEEEEPVPQSKIPEEVPEDARQEEMKPTEESEFAGPAAGDSEVKDLPVPEEKSQAVEEEKPPAAPEKKSKDARFKDVFKPTEPVHAPTGPVAEEDLDSGSVAPALHAATPALYIRDLMRPLRIETLRTHLVSLATPPSASPDPEILQSLFLDSMKTHALVLFSNTNAASRVRATLHGTVWPPEGQRKPLFIDFVPEDKIKDWIRQEEEHFVAEKEGRAVGRPIASKRFEVVYDKNPYSNTVEAIFQEVGAGAQAFNPPKGPRSNIEQRRPTDSHQQPPAGAPSKPAGDFAKSFQTLDQLFQSTTAKPKLYYLPVTDRIADRRLDDLDAETSRDWHPEERIRGRGAGAAALNQKMRYSFDEDDRVVCLGGDFGPWADDSAAGGGYRGGRRGGGFRSDHPPRGGFRSDHPYRGGFRGRGSGRDSGHDARF